MTEASLPWYQEWFKESYLELYPHRDEFEAIAQINFIIKHASQLSSDKIADVLDVACGAGRHVEQLAKLGFTVSGIDLSTELTELAKSRLMAANISANILQADMRDLPFAKSSFDLAISVFTSFGYFEDDATNENALRGWRHVLRAGGVLFIDFLNRDRVIQTLIEKSSRTIGDKLVEEIRSISNDNLRVEKKIVISQDDNTQTFTESVRMFTKEELSAMLLRNGFSDLSYFGDFSGSPFSADSERLLIFAKAI